MLEMIVVVCIMLILFGIVASSLTGFSRARKVRNSIERVATVLNVARSKAISDNAIYHVRVENRGPDNQWVSIYRFPKASDALKAVTESTVQNKISPPSMEVVEEVDTSNTVIRAYPKPSGWTGPTTTYTGTNGWNPGGAQARPDSKNKGMGFWYSNYLVASEKLEPGVYFETHYNPDTKSSTKGLWEYVGSFTIPTRSPPEGDFVDMGHPRAIWEIHPITTPKPQPDLFYSGLWDKPDPDPEPKAPPYYYPVLEPNADGDAANLVPKIMPDFVAYTETKAALLSFMPDGTASDNVLFLIRDEKSLGYVRVFKGGLIRSGDITSRADFKPDKDW